MVRVHRGSEFLMATSSGIYVIECVPTRKLYVGSSVNIPRRWREHRSQLVRGMHPNRHLQSAWRVHGPSAFSFCVLESCAPCQLIVREQHYVTTIRPVFNGSAVVSPSFIGRKHSDNSKALMRQAKVGRTLSESHKRHMSKTKVGKPHPLSPDAVARLVARNKSPEQIMATRLARQYQAPPMLGKAHSASTKAKISTARRAWWEKRRHAA